MLERKFTVVESNVTPVPFILIDGIYPPEETKILPFIVSVMFETPRPILPGSTEVTSSGSIISKSL